MATTISSGRANSPKLTANIADHGTIYGGRGLVMDGVVDKINFNTRVDITADWTISFWFKANGAANSGIWGQHATGSSYGFNIICYDSGDLRILWWDSGYTGRSLQTPSGSIPLNTWNHCTISWEHNTKLMLIVNGKKEAETTSNLTITGGGNVDAVTEYYGGSMSPKGTLADVKRFDCAITEAQAEELYLKPEQSAPSAIQANLKSWFPMCEGNPDSPQSIVYDHSEKKLGSEGLTANDTLTGATSSNWGFRSGWDSNNKNSHTTLTYNDTSVFSQGALKVTAAVGDGTGHMAIVLSDSNFNFNPDNKVVRIKFKYKVVQFDGSYVQLGVATSGGQFTAAGNPSSHNSTTDIVEFDKIMNWGSNVYFFLWGSNINTMEVHLTDFSIKEVLMGNHATTNFFGDELLTNGDFSSATGWTDASNLISSGVAHFDTSGSEVYIEQTNKTVVGKTYQLEYDITEYTSGTIKTRYAPSVTLSTSVDTGHTTTFVAEGTTFGLKRGSGSGTTDIKIDNVSLKEVGISSTGFATAQEEPTIPQVPLLRYNEKMVFDGVDNGVTATVGSTVLSSYTISCWIVASELSAYSRLVQVDDSTYRYLGLHSDGKIISGYSSGGWSELMTSATISAGELHHIVLVDNDTNTTIYIDGVAETIANSIQVDGADFIIGKYSTTNSFSGIIDDVSYFNTALSSTEVQELFNDGVALDATTHSKADTNLLGYWRNDGVSSWADRNDIQAINFDGTDDYIVTGSNVGISGSSAYSMNCWFKLNAYGSYPILMGSGAITGYNENSLLVRTDNNKVGWGNQIGANDFANADGTTISLNTWYMATFTFNGSDTIKIYINGALDGTKSVSSVNITNSVLYIGKRSNGLFLNGQMSQCAVYSSELSADDILGIYNLGRKNADLSASYPTNLTGYWFLNPSHSSPDVTGSNGIEDRSTNSNHGTQNGGVGFLGANDGTPAGTPESIIVREGLNSNKDGLGFPFNTDTRDCLRLDGASEYLQIPVSEGLQSQSALTLEAWIKCNPLTTAQGVISKDDTTNRVFNMAVLESTSGSANKVIFNIYSGGSAQGVTSSSVVADGDWHHIVGTFEPSTKQVIYVDGTAETTDTSSIPDTIDLSTDEANTPIRIGNYENNSLYFKGAIDEVKIYNRALSATEVSKNYKHGKGKHKN